MPRTEEGAGRLDSYLPVTDCGTGFPPGCRAEHQYVPRKTAELGARPSDNFRTQRMKIEDLPESYQEQARAQLERSERKPVIRREDLSTVADDLAERELQKLCELELSRREIPFLHLSPRAREKRGWPDLTFAMPSTGQAIAVELKVKGGKLSQDQIMMLTRMKASGWHVYVIRSFDLFRDLLNGYQITQWEAE